MNVDPSIPMILSRITSPRHYIDSLGAYVVTDGDFIMIQGGSFTHIPFDVIVDELLAHE